MEVFSGNLKETLQEIWKHEITFSSPHIILSPVSESEASLLLPYSGHLVPLARKRCGVSLVIQLGPLGPESFARMASSMGLVARLWFAKSSSS